MNEVQTNEMTTQTKVELKVETEDFITHLLEESYSEDDIYEFINEYGEGDFVQYYEEYVELGEENSYDAVDAFIEEFGIDSLCNFEDSYHGQWSSKGDFIEEFVNDCYCVDLPSFMEIDWEATFDNTDFIYHADGFVFNSVF